MSELSLTPLQRITVDCNGGAECMMDAPGHGLGAVQARVASATPSRWDDYLVAAVEGHGWVRLVSIDGRESVSVWNHQTTELSLGAGTPVSLHGVYNVLAAGTERLNVAVIAAD